MTDTRTDIDRMLDTDGSVDLSCLLGADVDLPLNAAPGVRGSGGDVALPAPRGPLSGSLLRALSGPVGDIDPWPAGLVEAASDDDLHLALYCCYELHYRGLPGVDDDWEWEPSLLALRRVLERRFEAELHRAVGPLTVGAPQVVDRLWQLATSGDGPSLSGWTLEHGTRDHARELAVHRSCYQLKEADPHTWAIPRLSGQAKATMVAIQADEYGSGDGSAMHSALFARTMAALGLDSGYNAYLDRVPGVTLATTNLISLLGLHRRHRAALLGHLAMFEMTSVGPMSRYAAWMERLDVDPAGRRFYDVHVEADEVHQQLASHTMIGSLVAADPDPGVARSVLFGALALSHVERRFTEHVLGCWTSGTTSLRRTTPVPVPQVVSPAS
jgi:hypothetical protein